MRWASSSFAPSVLGKVPYALPGGTPFDGTLLPLFTGLAFIAKEREEAVYGPWWVRRLSSHRQRSPGRGLQKTGLEDNSLWESP